MNFKNTYINTEGLSIPQLKALAAKYSKATGCEQEEYLSRLDLTWPYMRCDAEAVYVALNINKELGTEITEQDLDNYLQQKENTMNCPAFDFKINLSNMTEAEKEAAKKWLVSVADSRSMRCFPEYWGPRNLVTVDKKYIDCVQVGRDHKELNHLPEIFLTFSKPSVISWETPSKKSEKELQLEELVGKLQQQLKEAEQQLENLK